MNRFLLLLAASCLSGLVSARSIPYPVPGGIQSYFWSASVDGRETGVCRARTVDSPWHARFHCEHGGEYAVAMFDMDGTVRLVVRPVSGGVIRPIPDLSKTKILPATAPARIVRCTKTEVEIEVSRPCKFSVEPNGIEHPLIVLARSVERNPPSSSDPGVRMIGPGVVAPEGGVIRLEDNQTLYFRPGTVLKGSITAIAKRNVRICGHGIIDGSDIPWGRTPTSRVVGLERCRNARVEGITIVGSWYWTLIPWGCEDVQIDDVAICGSRVVNDDGINVVNSRRVTIRNSFVRSDDDCFTLKGINPDLGDCVDVCVEDCVLWCDRARPVLIAWVESACGRMKNLIFRNNDIIHFRGPAIMAVPIYECRLENMLFENVRIHNDREKVEEPVFRIFPSEVRNGKISGRRMSDRPGAIDGFVMRNVTIDGTPAQLKYQYDDGHGAAKKLKFENVTAFGIPLGVPQ